MSVNAYQKGIALPAGGRAIMTDKGDVCYVGYGSALIRSDDDPEMQAELTNDARKIATARALDSLTGMICGDAVVWEKRKEFEALQQAANLKKKPTRRLEAAG